LLSRGNSLEYKVKIGYMGGTIHKSDQLSMKRLIFRAMRGQATIHFFEVDQSETDNLCNLNEKLVFVIIYQYGDFIYRRLRKICEPYASSADPV
jgi:hypothetical protein